MSKTAQTNAQGSFLDSEWGVRISPSNITIFSGTSYAGRNPVNDINLSFSDKVSVSGVTEIVFSKLFGETVNTGLITFTGTTSINQFTINAKGILL